MNFNRLFLKVKGIIKKYAIYPAWCILDKYVEKNIVYKNINFDAVNRRQKRVLISYITDSFIKDLSLKAHHSNIIESSIIIKLFIDLNFCIDVIHCKDEENLSYIKTQKYDVVFGFGEPFYVACQYNENAKKIVYLTEAAPNTAKLNEMLRQAYYFNRHKKRNIYTRSGIYYKNEHINIAQYGILIGNSFTKRGYVKDFPRLDISLLNPTALICSKYRKLDKYCCTKDKNTFLWFGSAGAIHKGLDILLDVFAEIPEATLYICGVSKLEEHLLTSYEKYANIKNIGFVYVNSNEFLELINRVTYVILPSASEGMATSVLTCMKHGLIPVVTKNTGIDIEDYGIYLEDYTVEYVKNKILKIIECPRTDVEKLYFKLCEHVRDRFEERQFKDDINKILQNILFEQGDFK